MLSVKDVNEVYAIVFSSPSMDEEVKIGFRIPCKTVLLLSKVIELGLAVKDDSYQSKLITANPDALDDIKKLSADILDKAASTFPPTLFPAVRGS